MKQPSKFQRWVLGLFGGVPKSELEAAEWHLEKHKEMLESSKNQIQRLRDKRDELLEENELLKKQIAHDPMTPVAITTRNVKLKEIKKVAAIGPLPIEQTERYLRDAVLMEAAQCIRIEHKLSNLTATATLLIAEVEDV